MKERASSYAKYVKEMYLPKKGKNAQFEKNLEIIESLP